MKKVFVKVADRNIGSKKDNTWPVLTNLLLLRQICQQKLFPRGSPDYKISITNPEAITYHTEEIGYTILGGIRLEGLDRLRVTIKVEVVNRKFQHYLNNPDIAALAIRQNLDLYSITQTEKLARLIADRLEVGVTQVIKDLASITNELERYRLEQIEEKQQERTKQVKPFRPCRSSGALAVVASFDQQL